MREIFEGVYLVGGKLATMNSTPGYRVYGEKTVKDGGKEYRIWDPYRSKVAAALAKGMRSFPLRRGSFVLYLGASSGTTASHIADIADTVYCVEFSKRMMRELLLVCERKQNMVPILADARHPWEYTNALAQADVLIQDVAQPDQAGIVNNNYDTFKFKDVLLSIKARSINSVKDPQKVFRAEVDKLKKRFNVIQEIDLQPYEEDHILVNLKAK
jgi:fibrillarin-like pre-rRNA processing protein